MSSKVEDAEAGGWSPDADDANMEAVARLYNKAEDYKTLYQRERQISLERMHRAYAAEAKADRLAKLLGEARDWKSTRGHAAVVDVRLPEDLRDRIAAALSAVSGLAEKEVGDGT